MTKENGNVSHIPRVSVVLGTQFGDEGKGKLVDLLSLKSNIVCRCQGGNNAGHTVISNGEEYFFHLLPSGMVNPNSLGIIGNGTVVDLNGLFKEIEEAHAKGLKDIEKRLRISNRAHIVFELHQKIDALEEELRGKNSIGTTKKGIGPAYASKITRNGMRMCDIVGDWESFVKNYTTLVCDAKRRYPKLVHDVEKDLARLQDYRIRLQAMVCDTISLVNEFASNLNSVVLIEGAQSCMLDIDFGTYPNVTSSNCTIGGVCTGLGLAPSRIGSVYGVVKAYTTRVGSGPFPTELNDEIGDQLQNKGQEWGVTTKRRRRVGWLDTVIVRYAHLINNFTAVALTKLDVLDGLDEVRICKDYEDPKSGQKITQYPADCDSLSKVRVVYESMPGWKECTHGIKSFDALPKAAQNYVLAIERLCGVQIGWIGTGASRDSIIVRH